MILQQQPPAFNAGMPAPVMTTMDPAFMTAPAAEFMNVPSQGPSVAIDQPMLTTAGMAVPVTTNMKPPVPVASTEVMMGGVRQMRMPPNVAKDEQRAMVTQYAPTTMATREQGQAVYVQKPSQE